jgi:ribosomal protein S19
MARSVWKGPFVEESLMKKVDKYKEDPKKFQLKHGQESQQYYLTLLVLVFKFIMVKNLYQ